MKMRGQVETYNFNFSSRIGMLVLEILTVLTWFLNVAQSWRVRVAYSKVRGNESKMRFDASVAETS